MFNELFFEKCCTRYTSDSDMRKGSNNIESFGDKVFILNTYVNYFKNIVMSMFDIENLPTYKSIEIPQDFIKQCLITNGNIAVVKNSDYGIVLQPFSTVGLYNIYGEPTEIELKSFYNASTELSGNKYDYKDFQIVRINHNSNSLLNIIYYFSNKIVELQRAIDVNVYANQSPLVFEGTSEQEHAITKLFKDWDKQLKAVFIKKDKGGRAEDLIKSFSSAPEFKADRMIEVFNYYLSQFYTMLGINHTPYEKKERLLDNEVNSNNQLLNLTLKSMIDTLNRDFEKVNKKFGLNIKVVPYTDNKLFFIDNLNDLSRFDNNIEKMESDSNA